MKILGIDSSAKSASVAVTDDNKVITQFYINTGLTHSQTLMPMVKNALECSGVSLDDIDIFAVNKGPGSFTGIRIGVAAVKGMADVKQKKCLGVSTLESMAYNLLGNDCIACCVMDARCNQAYTALFEVKNDQITRLTEDKAISVDELCENLKKYDKLKIFIGDGADLCYNKAQGSLKNIILADEGKKYQSAVGTCFAAKDHITEAVNSSELVPEYLRLPQAQRELNNKLNK